MKKIIITLFLILALTSLANALTITTFSDNTSSADLTYTVAGSQTKYLTVDAGDSKLVGTLNIDDLNIPSTVNLINQTEINAGGFDSVIIGDTLFNIQVFSNLQSFNLSNNMQQLDSLSIGLGASGLCKSEDNLTLYVTQPATSPNDLIFVINITDPTNLVQLSSFNMGSTDTLECTTKDDVLYFPDTEGTGIKMYNTTNLSNVVFIRNETVPVATSRVLDLQWEGDFLNIMTESLFSRYNMSEDKLSFNISANNNRFYLSSNLCQLTDRGCFKIKDDILYTSFELDGNDGFKIINLTPTNPVLLDSFLDTDRLGVSILDFQLKDEFIYLTDFDNGIIIYDLTNKSSPVHSISISNSSFALEGRTIDPYSNLFYFGTGTGTAYLNQLNITGLNVEFTENLTVVSGSTTLYSPTWTKESQNSGSMSINEDITSLKTSCNEDTCLIPLIFSVESAGILQLSGVNFISTAVESGGLGGGTTTTEQVFLTETTETTPDFFAKYIINFFPFTNSTKIYEEDFLANKNLKRCTTDNPLVSCRRSVLDPKQSFLDITVINNNEFIITIEGTATVTAIDNTVGRMPFTFKVLNWGYAIPSTSELGFFSIASDENGNESSGIPILPIIIGILFILGVFYNRYTA